MVCRRSRNTAAIGFGEVPDPSQKAKRNSRSPPRPSRNFNGTLCVHLNGQLSACSQNNGRQCLGRIKLEPKGNAKTIPERRRQKTGPRCCANKSERRQIKAHRSRSGSLPNHNIDGIVLHGRIKDFLDCGRQTVDLINEKDIIGLKVGEDGDQIARLRDHWSRCRPKSNPEFPSEYLREGRFS